MASLSKEMPEKQPGIEAENLVKLLEPELEPLLQESGTALWVLKMTVLP